MSGARPCPTVRGYRGSIISGPVSRSATAFNFCIQGQIRLTRHLVIGSQGRWPFPGGDAASVISPASDAPTHLTHSLIRVLVARPSALIRKCVRVRQRVRNEV